MGSSRNIIVLQTLITPLAINLILIALIAWRWQISSQNCINNSSNKPKNMVVCKMCKLTIPRFRFRMLQHRVNKITPVWVRLIKPRNKDKATTMQWDLTKTKLHQRIGNKTNRAKKQYSNIFKTLWWPTIMIPTVRIVWTRSSGKGKLSKRWFSSRYKTKGNIWIKNLTKLQTIH